MWKKRKEASSSYYYSSRGLRERTCKNLEWRLHLAWLSAVYLYMHGLTSSSWAAVACCWRQLRRGLRRPPWQRPSSIYSILVATKSLDASVLASKVELKRDSSSCITTVSSAFCNDTNIWQSQKCLYISPLIIYCVGFRFFWCIKSKVIKSNLLQQKLSVYILVDITTYYIRLSDEK